MALSLRAVRRKIRTVKNIQKITSAMKMVAAARLRRVQERVTAGKPYALKMKQLVEEVGPFTVGIDHPLLTPRPGRKNPCVVVISGDKGLCGSFNNNIIRKAQTFIDELGGTSVQLITIGKKGTLYFRKRGYNVLQSFSQIGVNSPFSEVQTIADAMTGMYTSGKADEVHVAYTEFITTMRQRPHVGKFLPIEPPGQTAKVEASSAGRPAADKEYIFEPAAAELLKALLPKFVRNQVYKFLLESMASEQGARMTAMSNATDSAGDVISDLTTAANKARQATITKELLEVVNGAEALAAQG
ncbi:MAG: ATP synthase F1 subunit gamma [Candidatus Wallbacteria bacterium]|nr:ATP synthase F1 subunit gamma [Candidatus Wallbacteria bacterium]